MAVSDAQKRATAKWQKANYEDMKVRVPKGDRDKYREQAVRKGFTSLNSYIIKLLEADAIAE